MRFSISGNGGGEQDHAIINFMLVGQKFFDRSTIELAKALLGKYLVYGNLRGKIVETEAYLYRDDPGCHASNGLTARNAPMFGPAGHTYVYFIYGMYYCLNVVSGKTGEGEAVLIRALEPVQGMDVMKERRKTNRIENLCNGPGKLTQAFGITKKHNNLSLLTGELQIHGSREKPEIICSTRIGLSAGKDLELRFFIAGNGFVSRFPPPAKAASVKSATKNRAARQGRREGPAAP